MKKVCIVGCGAAGLLLLYNLQNHGVNPDQVIVIDTNLCGGDLQKQWYCVRSNTLWSQLLNAVPYPGTLPERFSCLDPSQPCSLRHYIDYLKDVVQPYLKQCEIHCTSATKAFYEGNHWNIELKVGSPVKADILLLATGSEPKHLNLPYPSIPLCTALNEERLRDYVKSGDHILVFGTAHSATLIVRNLVNCGAAVTNFYATPKPFYFDRDGDYDGLKQDAATIADRILDNQLPVKLVSIQDTTSVIRQTKRVDGVIYAIGFESRNPFGLKDYDGETGQLKDVPNAWGFGIAYPNKASDGVHWDVSIPAFQTHIEKQMPNILSQLRIE
jgi:pyruvate/2-oxoglutarate dehydrogenase complex dihydrolipoamide dehydrogenase (E3) component